MIQGHFGCIVAKTTDDIKFTTFIFCEDVKKLSCAFCGTSVTVAVTAACVGHWNTDTRAVLRDGRPSCFTLNGPMVWRKAVVPLNGASYSVAKRPRAFLTKYIPLVCLLLSIRFKLSL